MPEPALQRLIYSGFQYARLRSELLEIELSEERERLTAMLIAGLVLSVGAIASFHAIAALVIFMAWETQWRLPAVLLFVVLALAITAYAWLRLRRLKREAKSPLRSLLNDLSPPDQPGREA